MHRNSISTSKVFITYIYLLYIFCIKVLYGINIPMSNVVGEWEAADVIGNTLLSEYLLSGKYVRITGEQ